MSTSVHVLWENLSTLSLQFDRKDFRFIENMITQSRIKKKKMMHKWDYKKSETHGEIKM